MSSETEEEYESEEDVSIDSGSDSEDISSEEEFDIDLKTGEPIYKSKSKPQPSILAIQQSPFISIVPSPAFEIVPSTQPEPLPQFEIVSSTQPEPLPQFEIVSSTQPEPLPQIEIVSSTQSDTMVPIEQIAPSPILEKPIDITMFGIVPTPKTEISKPIQIFKEAIDPVVKRKRKPKVVTTTPTPAPSQIIYTITPSQMSFSPIVSEQQVQLPQYDPTLRSPGESDVEYQRRIQIYNLLISSNVPSESADTLARMRNNVDIHGVKYSDTEMNVLNSYLPIIQ